MFFNKNKGSYLATLGKGAVASCSMALIVGCQTLGPDYLTPDVPIRSKWSEVSSEISSKKEISEKIDYDKWWLVFNDEVLNSLVETAKAQNHSLKIAGVRILEAKARLGIATGNKYPQQQQLRAGILKKGLSENSANFSPSLDTSYLDNNVGLDIGWELDVWGRFKRGIEAADADMLASFADYDDVMVRLVSSVALVYTQVRTLEERLHIAKSNVTIQTDSLRVAMARLDNGVTTELDVFQAKTLLLNTQASIPALEVELQKSLHALSVLLGAPPGNLQLESLINQSIPVAPLDVAVGIPAELLRRRPDIKRAELQAAAQSARIGIAEAELYPHFTLTGSIGLRSSDTFDSHLSDLFHSDSIETFVGPSLTWNIFNYGRIKNNVRVQDARLQQLIVAYQRTVLESLQEVEDAIVGFVRAKEQVAFFRESSVTARSSVDLSLIQYRDGAVNYQRVLDSQKTLASQQDLYVSSRGNVAVNLIQLYKALGGGERLESQQNFMQDTTYQQMGERTDWGGLITDSPLAR